ncbi:hypothetical protein [Bacillus sp. FJAT-50079]|uniref:hypothetical protein n=1 Tax=Bacillus sp. FJAT-50079 TaxID=2833577 RepID=UPI001BC9445F|nr:hypothetical protein [Bacillus sp. FJAT-50079]MBS4209948.1 hypothetical protein [Bacillus sp. FJAT-50079]
MLHVTAIIDESIISFVILDKLSIVTGIVGNKPTASGLYKNFNVGAGIGVF